MSHVDLLKITRA